MKTLTTGEISHAIGINVSTALLESIGIQPVLKTKVGVYWNEKDIVPICENLIKLLQSRIEAFV